MTDLCIEFLYLLVSRGRRADGVSFSNELFGGFTEVSDHVRDVTLRDVVFCGGIMILRNWVGLTRR